MILKILGGLLVGWGVLDFGMSWSGTDIWDKWLGIDLWAINELLGKYVAWAEIFFGGLLWSMGGNDEIVVDDD